MTLSVTRRQVLRWGLAGGTAVILPSAFFACGDGDESLRFPPSSAPTTSFLTADELRVVTAVTARIVPTDDLPGAIEAGAANYISRLLAVVPDEHSPGNVFAGGPFSDRNPFPDPATGTPSTRLPTNNFTHFIPLTRLQLLSWRVQLLGSAAVPGANFNDGVIDPVIGIRDRYRTGVAEIQTKSREMFSADFPTLSSAQQDAVLAAINPDFRDLITAHTIEGMFCVPEYGGNTNRVGWELIQYDGDSQPLGYAIFDTTTMSYTERPDKPTSTANPGEDFAGVDATTQRFLKLLVRVTGGPHFP